MGCVEMGERGAVKITDHPKRIADRYLVQDVLGQGGMAVVYRVIDTVTKKNVALKKLLPERNKRKQRQTTELFEQEYYTLAEFSHPRVVEVYDFGIAEQQAYYTMELLDGGDLRELSPLPWRKLCSLIRDICSVLSLLHSRRLVHRDITPRNVRCTEDSKAKLIDFGAMVPMGACKQAVGTPAFTAPEVIALQTLDAQTDLYSLGTTLYYALTGNFAYPARTFGELRRIWQRYPKVPSSYNESIPKELDNLTMSLIELEPMARPMNAAEVIDRLNAIASLEVDEQLQTSRSYLLKPTLVGRSDAVVRVRKKLVRALKRTGNALLVTGESGVGRSRFLDACALEGKLSGATVLRADADDAQTGDWGVVRKLTARLMDALPEIAINTSRAFLPVLGRLFPEILERVEQGKIRNQKRISIVKTKDPQVIRPRVHAALCDWLRKVSQQRCLAIAVDDVHRIDEPSAAFIALLANQLSDRKLFLVTTCDSDARYTSATRLLASTASSLKLRNLSSEDTTRLLISVFGEVPNVQLLSYRLYRVSHGNPGAILQFAQHLVDANVIQYHAGAWSLPQKFEATDLPDTLSAALKVKASKLSDDALRLIQTLALSPQQSFSNDECARLIDAEDKSLLRKVISELRTYGIGATDGHNFSLDQLGWVSVLVEGMKEQQLKICHRNLAEVFLRRGNQACRAAKHLFEAGYEERGLDVLTKDCETNKKRIDESSQAYSEYLISLPEDWAEIFERALDICDRLDRPPIQSYYLRILMARIGDQAGLQNTAPVLQAVQQLVHDSGLQMYYELGDSVDAEQRIWKALELTQKRYEASDESQRVMPPFEAIPDLARTLSNVIGITTGSYDYETLAAMPSLEPLAILSPSLGIINQSVQCTLYSHSSHFELAVEGFRKILQRISQPDRAGFDETIHKYIDLGHRWGLGMMEASFGNKSSIVWVKDLEDHPLHQVNAWYIRLVYYLRQGDIEKAEACKKRIEILRIQNSPTQFYEGAHNFVELTLYSLVEDLIRVKRLIPTIETMANRYTTWMPILHFAKGEYQRIRGDFESAVKVFEKGLALIQPGRHIVWAALVGGYIKALFELHRIEEAKQIGERNLCIAQELGLEFASTSIQLPLAVIQANTGAFELAVQNCDAIIACYQKVGSTGATLGAAYETRALVAILMNDKENFEIYARSCAEQYKTGKYPPLVAKYEKLMQKAQNAMLIVTEDLANAAESTQQVTQERYSELISAMFTDCKGPVERAQYTLRVLIERSNSTSGFLYIAQKNGLVLKAQDGHRSIPKEMDSLVQDYIDAEISEFDDVTMTVADLEEPTQNRFSWPNDEDSKYHPVILGHKTEDGYAITGLAVLCIPNERDFCVPGEAVAVLSRSLFDTGDAVTLLAA